MECMICTEDLLTLVAGELDCCDHRSILPLRSYEVTLCRSRALLHCRCLAPGCQHSTSLSCISVTCSFCSECILRWAEKDSRCPACRGRFRSVTEKVLEKAQSSLDCTNEDEMKHSKQMLGKVIKVHDIPERNQVWCWKICRTVASILLHCFVMM